MSDTSKTPAEIAMAAAVAKQSEATASQMVADTTAAESKANPKDANLIAAAKVTQDEATKDQAAADEALALAISLETAPESTPAVIAEGTAAEQAPQEQAPVVVEPIVVAPVVKPVVVQVAKAPAAKVAAKTISGSVVNEVQATPAPSAESSTAPISGTSSDFAAAIAKFKESGTLAERTLIVQMEQYIDAMMPGKPVTPEAGARSQHALWRTILSTIERSGEEFKSIYNLLLAYFEEYKNGAFHERYVFRFAEMISMPTDELATFQRTLNLIKLTCSPVGRAQSLKQVDLNRTLKDVFSEQGRQAILGFYGK